MKKIKSIAFWIGAFMAVTLAISLLGIFKKPVLPPVETPSSYTITYKAVRGGKIEEIDEELYIDDGNYPTLYVQGTPVEVDDLKDYVSVSSTHDLEFRGWYWDPQFTREFNGTTEETSGDLTIYAKITDGYWTANY